MIAPPLLVGAAWLAWGYASGQLVVAAVLGLVFEAVRFAAPGDLSLARREPAAIRGVVLGAAALFVFAGSTQPFPGAIYFALRWLPLVLFPIALLQALAPARSIDAASLRAAAGLYPAPRARSALDVTHFLVAAALIGAAASDPAARWFYPAAAAIAAWALLARAPRRVPATALLAVAAAMGFAIHTGLATLQSRIEDWSTELLQEYFSAGADPFRERTRIGDLGRIKLSDRIAMRVAPVGPRPPQLLLREASFDTYVGGEWRTRSRVFTSVAPVDSEWRLHEGAVPQALVIRRAFGRGEGVLALPAGAGRIPAAQGATLSTLATGTVRAQNLPSFLSLRVGYEPAADFAGAPTAADLEVPELLRPALEQVIAEQAIPRDSPRAAEARLGRFFSERFGYSLTLSDGKGGTRTLRDFLLKDHKGHCEYFAAATALLLRQAGVPARYTVGYSAQEYSALEKAFVVRDRHAHAWASAWIDGRWIEVDNTPARWADLEERDARAWYGPMLDLASWAIDRLRRLLAEPAWDGRALALAFGAAALVAGGLLAWRRRGARAPRGTAPPEHPATSAWRRIEASLAARGFAPRTGETPRAFVDRVALDRGADDDLRGLVRRYYAARFDPASGAEHSARLVEDVGRWLAKAPSQEGPSIRST